MLIRNQRFPLVDVQDGCTIENPLKHYNLGICKGQHINVSTGAYFLFHQKIKRSLTD